MLSKFAIGSDLTLLNTYYLYPKKNEQTNKYDKGVMTLIYKDNVSGEKHIEEIVDPSYEFYHAKPNEVIESNLFFIEKEKTEKISVPVTQLEKTIAEMTGNMPFYKENIAMGNRYGNKKLHTDERVFLSDMHIEDHYRSRFSNLYTNSIIQITKSYFDIECDTIKMKGIFPEMGECPVNAITYIDDKNGKVFTFLLRNKDNPLIQEFENSINDQLFVELKAFVKEACGGWKNEIRFKLQDLSYEILFYDDEIELIADFFKIVNVYKPDFLLAWNMFGFDIPYLIERIKVLGYDPADIMCHPDFKFKVAKCYVDERNKNDLAERGDYATISSYTVYLDQMVHFASRRKGQGVFTSFGLDFIGDKVAKVRKLDYSHITTDIAQLPWKNYRVFVFYNIMDTIVQKCVEVRTGDIDYIFNKCLMNNTRYQKGHRQTVYLVNRAAKEFFKDGLILGNNNNRDNEKPPKFDGALVTSPLLLNDYGKLKINGNAISVLNNLDDFDYKSLYPSMIREMNMAPNTQIGKVVIPESVHSKENRFGSETYNRGGSFIEDLQSHVWLEFCTRWLHLADYATLYNDISEFFTTVRRPTRALRWYDMNGKVNPVEFMDKNLKVNPVSFNNGPTRLVDFYIKPQIDTVLEFFNDGGR